MGANVVGITYYPVKGCAGVELTEATVTPQGLLDDRAWEVVDEEGEPRWQGADPRLAVIAPLLGDGGLTLRAPETEPLTVTDSGPEADAWLTRVLGRPSRLVRASAGNASRLHVVSRASLDALNRRIAARGAHRLPMNRFRPNLVVDGWTTPHTEDDTPRLTVAGVELALTELTVRCAVTMVDQSTGRRAGPEPLRTLAGHRRADGAGGVVFGAYFAVRRPGRIAVGDEVTAESR
ncbi:MOSC domain-containing protein [Streptomyces sp. NBC_00582]|uniref:MOSC domain-containing protein n=1 Tax=Streptomyces sp. NBC_00582 TaxID=2975783 RepID=UPI0010638549|nr:MOSC domain-containing protein [Streptomyces sp. NBC_00582]WUB63182.1 MOSC domain-containing protein [Streptomyces sp. NBC_00582]